MTIMFRFSSPVRVGASVFVRLLTRIDLPVSADRGQFLGCVLCEDGSASLCLLDGEHANHTALAQRRGTKAEFDHLLWQLVAGGQAEFVTASRRQETHRPRDPRIERQRPLRSQISP